eukprot:gnl/MRDRNA2_/MRDRNA2_18913_c0_seq1.p1 gnl/MRDRNA2_/MRDRNA2_18913_c0~~gnl/MRDRNA2_/MRDRNA2_18913_c0_seq1.p1  ORF type:complete len:418 (+),score=82.99 gnl/MRDRNA2_/MRDRNA2_18913_c0_seq1:44-1297(+)
MFDFDDLEEAERFQPKTDIKAPDAISGGYASHTAAALPVAQAPGRKIPEVAKEEESATVCSNKIAVLKDAAAGGQGDESKSAICIVCGGEPKHRCSACKVATYCSIACQRTHFKFHKAECARFKARAHREANCWIPFQTRIAVRRLQRRFQAREAASFDGLHYSPLGLQAPGEDVLRELLGEDEISSEAVKYCAAAVLQEVVTSSQLGRPAVWIADYQQLLSLADDCEDLSLSPEVVWAQMSGAREEEKFEFIRGFHERNRHLRSLRRRLRDPKMVVYTITTQHAAASSDGHHICFAVDRYAVRVYDSLRHPLLPIGREIEDLVKTLADALRQLRGDSPSRSSAELIPVDAPTQQPQSKDCGYHVALFIREDFCGRQKGVGGSPGMCTVQAAAAARATMRERASTELTHRSCSRSDA